MVLTSVFDFVMLLLLVSEAIGDWWFIPDLYWKTQV
jgi:hypothetical protein